MEQKMIDRLNELARKAKEGPLTPEEDTERAALRKDYIAAYRESLRRQLDSTFIVTPDGQKQPLRKKSQKQGTP